jgi:hypothetical protein
MIETRRMRWAEHGIKRNACRILMGTPKRRKHLGSPRRRRKDNIKEIGWRSIGWIDLAQDWDQMRALVNTVMNLQVP